MAANVALLIVMSGAYGSYALAAVVLVPLLIGLARRPQRGVLLVAALLPYDGLLLVLPVPAFARAWKEALVVCVLIATFLAPVAARAQRRRKLPPWAAATAALVVIGAASALLAGVHGALTSFRIYFFFLLLAWAIWRCPLVGKDRDLLVTIFMANGVITAIYGVAQELIGVNRLHALGYAYDTAIRTTHGHLRAFSSFAYQTPFGFYLMVVLLLGLSAALSDPRRRRNRIFFCCLPLLGAALFFTYERSAWVGLCGGLLYLAVRRHHALLLFVPLALLAVAFLPASLQSASVSSSSLGQRTTSWKTHLSEVASTPLGHGIGSSGAAAAKVASTKAGGSSFAATTGDSGTYNPDDGYITVAYDLGIVGLWVYLLVLAGAGVTAHTMSIRVPGSDRAFAEATAAFVVAVALGSATTVVFELSPLDAIWWLLVAAVSVAEPKALSMAEPESPGFNRIRPVMELAHPPVQVSSATDRRGL